MNASKNPIPMEMMGTKVLEDPVDPAYRHQKKAHALHGLVENDDAVETEPAAESNTDSDAKP